MNSSPPRSSPPPGLPRDLVARARIQTETEELGKVADARVQAALEFELGALHEHGLGDVELAAEHYRRALEQRRSFRPALFALARVYADTDKPLAAAEVWDALARTTRAPAESAAAMCEAGILLHDRLDQRDRAAELWEEALALDPSCSLAALLLEHHHRIAPSAKEARRAVELHARGLSDAELEAALLLELAAGDERAGDTATALARLAEAAELDPRGSAHWYERERIARRHRLREPLVAALAALAAREQDSPARRAALLCEAGRLLAVQSGDGVDPATARPLYDRALELVPDDTLGLWERSLLHAALADPESAIADAHALLAAAPDPALSAAVRVRLGALYSAQGADEDALRELTAAVAAAPESATANAALEDALLRTGGYAALRVHLSGRAERGAGAARSEHLLRAARIALVQLAQPALALELMERAVVTAERPQRVLRALHAAAVFAGDQTAAIDAVERLCRAELEPGERSLLRFDQYHRILRAGRDGDAAIPLLERLLHERELGDWAPQAARIHAAGARRYRLLAEAHDALAASAGEDARASAHLSAAARALARAGEPRAAAERAHAALKRAPDDDYALALLEACLLAVGDGHEAATVLREAARTHAGSKQRELGLLHAGAAAETAGDPHAAARAYEEAAELDPVALAPRWALLRLAERTRDRGALLAALERLAKRERELSGSGIANLELGELLGAQRLGQAASSPLRCALERADTRIAAAFELCMLPANEIAPALRDDAVAALAESAAEGVGLPLLRDGVAVRLQTDAYGARALLDALAAEHDSDPSLALTAFAAASGEADRSQVLLRLSQVTSDRNAAAELILHGTRVALLARGDEAAEDALLRALDAAQEAPESLAAAVALDEALWAGDDAESRLLALSGRLAHASVETRGPLLAARARALLAAGRAGEAAEAARAALADDPHDLALWELLRAAARARGDWESAAEATERLAHAADGRLRIELLEEAAVLLQNELGHSERAERCLRAAFEGDPRSELAFSWLHDLLLERRDLSSLLALIDRRGAAIDDLAERLELRYERALLLRAEGRKEQTVAALDDVLVLDPRHAGALGLLAETCTALEQWPAAVSALRRLAEADVPDAQKRLARLGAADFLERKLDDIAGACAELEALCALDPDEVAQRVRLAGLHERTGRYRDAVHSYTAAAAQQTGADAAALERRAAAILRDPLGAVGEAVEACQRALAADPLDEQACALLLEVTDAEAEREPALSGFAGAVYRALERNPLRPELLRKLRRLGQFRRRTDVERVALHVLRALDAADDDERRALSALDREAARDRRLGADVLARLAGSLQTTTLARPAQIVSSALATLSGEAQGRSDAGTALPAALSSAQRFDAGARALARQLGVASLQGRERAAQRDAFHAALALVDGARASAESAALAKQLGKQMARADRKELARALSALAQPEREIEAYLDALAAACTRAGMVAADDLAPALALPAGHADVETLTRTPGAIAALRFWLSRDLLELRRELGWSP